MGLLVVPDGAISRKEYRRRIRETYLRSSPERGSFFIIFVLPIIISLVSNWIAKWIVNRTDMREIRSEAFDVLTDSLPPTTGTPTSTSIPPKNQTEQPES